MVEQRIALGYQPRPWQSAVHIALHEKRWGVLVAHRRSGKTVLAVMQIIHRAIACPLKDGRYAYLAPELKQVKDLAWRYLKQYTEKIPGVIVSESELHVTLPNGARIRLYGADNPNGMRGIYLDGVVLDEVGQLPKDLWDSVIRPALSDRQGWALFMGTPMGINLFSEVYYKALNDSDWYHGHYTVYQTKSLAEKEVADLKKEMTESAFAREYLCSFDAAVDNVLLSVDDVETACRRHFGAHDYMYAPKILGVDVARQGDDRTCIYPRQGIFSDKPYIYRHLDSMEVAAKVMLIDDAYHADAIFVDGSGGYGAGVIDRLRQLGRPCIEVQFGGKADDERFANKRSEMAFLAAEWVKKTGLIQDIHEVKQDLCIPTYGHDNKGRMILESKDSMKKRGLPSCDIFDGFMLTFAYPVQAKGDRMLQSFGQPASLQQYDPLTNYLSELNL